MWRYSLRTALVLVAMLATGLAYCAHEWRCTSRDVELLSAFAETYDGQLFAAFIANAAEGKRLNSGGTQYVGVSARTVAQDPNQRSGFVVFAIEPLPYPLRIVARLIGKDDKGVITEVQTYCKSVGDKHMEILANTTRLRSVELHRSHVTDDAIATLCKSKNIRRVAVAEGNEGITESGRAMASSFTAQYGYDAQMESLD